MWLFPRKVGLWGKVQRIIPCLRFVFLFLVCLFVSFKWRLACTQFHSFRPLSSPQRLSELRRLWTNVPGRVASELVSLMVSYAMPGHARSRLLSEPTPTSLAQGCVCVFSCNLPPTLLAERPVSLTCYCGNTGVVRIPK